LLVAVLLVFALPVSADIYRWIDSQGKVHYSDNPPPDAAAKQIKVKTNSIEGTAIAYTADDAPLAQAKDRVRIFTAAWCGYCKRAKAYLSARGIPFEEIDVETTERGRSEFAQIGGRGVPVIFVGTQRMDGFDAQALGAMLSAAHY
jgi:glutaredoxin